MPNYMDWSTLLQMLQQQQQAGRGMGYPGMPSLPNGIPGIPPRGPQVGSGLPGMPQPPQGAFPGMPGGGPPRTPPWINSQLPMPNPQNEPGSRMPQGWMAPPQAPPWVGQSAAGPVGAAGAGLQDSYQARPPWETPMGRAALPPGAVGPMGQGAHAAMSPDGAMSPQGWQQIMQQLLQQMQGMARPLDLLGRPVRT